VRYKRHRVKRYLVQRNGEALASGSIPTTGALVASPNKNRLGGEIFNTSASGGSGLLLYLGAIMDELGGGYPTALGAYPTVYLPPAGGNWNFEFGEILWCGSVWGVGVGGTATIAGGEL
jgi:hypothetical protein